MANTRQYLAALIGLVGGAWAAGAEARRRHEHEGEVKETPEHNPFPALSGRKGGSMVSTRPAPATAAPLKARPRAAENFGTAKNRGNNQEPPTAEYDPECLSEKPVSEPGSEVKHTDVAVVDGSFGYLKELYKRFNGDLCPAWAASLSFFALLAIGPVLLCGLAILGFLIQDPAQAADYVQKVIANILPGGNAQDAAAKIIADMKVQQHAAELMEKRGTAGIIGILSLFWAASRIFVNAATPMNAAFRTKETRGFVKMQVYAFGLLFGAGALFLLSLLPASGTGVLRHIPFLASLPEPSNTWMKALFFIIFFTLGVIINAAMYTVIYRYLPSPSAKVEWKEAAFAGGIVAVLFEAAKHGFAFYLQRFGSDPEQDKVYGALGGMIILVLWVYYSSMILLLGAEIAKLHSDIRDAKARGVKA